MIIIDHFAGTFEEKKRTFRVLAVDAYPLELERNVRTYQTNEVRVIPYQKTWWLNDDKGTEIELAMKKEVRKWGAVFPYGDTTKGKARVSPNDVSYTKTRF